jgi:preprotein translocase subunit SecG
MIFETLLWILFVLSSLLLCLIILIQEGKGGGLAEAFGGQGAETFGVKSKGVNVVTASLAGVMFLSAIFINRCSYLEPTVHFDAGSDAADTGAGGAGGAAGDAGTTDPAGQGG